MPDLGFYHPIVIHFAIGLLPAGVAFRWLSLTGRLARGPAAASLILMATAATLVAVRSGDDAHVAVEAVPGLAAAVRAHQTWGERTQALVLAVGVLELVALALPSHAHVPGLRLASAGIGLVAVLAVLQTGKLGGDLVYARAGGVGIRSGDSADVARLLLAGLVDQADVDEKEGRQSDAANLLELAARRFPADAAVQLLAAGAVLRDRGDPASALAILERLGPIPDEPDLHFRRGWLTAEALDGLGRRPEARAELARLQAEFPDNRRLRARLAREADRAP
jgi:uncharacterized membrane protein